MSATSKNAKEKLRGEIRDAFEALVAAMLAGKQDAEKVLEELVQKILNNSHDPASIDECFSAILGPLIKVLEMSQEYAIRIYCAVKVFHAIREKRRAIVLSRNPSVEDFLNRIRNYPSKDAAGFERIVEAKGLIADMDSRGTDVLDQPVDE